MDYPPRSTISRRRTRATLDRMSMSDCPKCWDTPCSCGYGYERPRMSLERLREVVVAASRVLADREATGDPEPVLHPQQQLTAKQWSGSIPVSIPPHST